jgi:cytochrome c oxidase accessory protein FixG
MLGVTFLIVFDFGWFREQFCVIVCPYGRIQSLLMDQNSLAVMYDSMRGEPRGKRTPEKKNLGSCVDCYRCVAVCPTGIDIRRGVQMECIACTSCIDACDDVMSKTGQAPGLIRYESHNGMNGIKAKKFSVRSLAYLMVIVLAIFSLEWIVTHRKPIDATLIRGHDTPYQVVTEGQLKGLVQNHFKLNLKNTYFVVLYSFLIGIGSILLLFLIGLFTPIFLESLGVSTTTQLHQMMLDTVTIFLWL